MFCFSDIIWFFNFHKKVSVSVSVVEWGGSGEEGGGGGVWPWVSLVVRKVGDDEDEGGEERRERC